MLDDVTSVTLHTALSSLAKRQRVTADNIANVDTPNFQAGRVTFEDALRNAVSNGGNPADVTASVGRSVEPTRENGNNVNLDHETLSQIDTGLRYQAALRAMDSKFGLIRDVVRGGA